VGGGGGYHIISCVTLPHLMCTAQSVYYGLQHCLFPPLLSQFAKQQLLHLQVQHTLLSRIWPSATHNHCWPYLSAFQQFSTCMLPPVSLLV
jgi:hypothetical protein